MRNIFEKAQEAIRAGKALVLCSVIESKGSAPRGAGAKMLVFENGETFGTVGGGIVEHDSIRLARRAFSERISFTRRFELSEKGNEASGMICGGSAAIYFQYISADDGIFLELTEYALSLFDRGKDAWLVTAVNEYLPQGMGIYCDGSLLFLKGILKGFIEPHLSSRALVLENKYYIEPLVRGGYVYIFGGGHIARALVPVIAKIGFRTIVYDDRESCTYSPLFPDAVRTVLGDFSCINENIKINSRDYVIIATRGHMVDYQVLKDVLRSGAYYIGMVGSRNKFAYLREQLLESGFEAGCISRVRCPIGIPILAKTPEEIAISIAAELVRCRAEQE